MLLLSLWKYWMNSMFVWYSNKHANKMQVFQVFLIPTSDRIQIDSRDKSLSKSCKAIVMEGSLERKRGDEQILRS